MYSNQAPYTKKSIDYVLSTTKEHFNSGSQLRQMLKNILKNSMI